MTTNPALESLVQTPALSATRIASDALRPVRIWLYAMAALVLLMVVVGGITRLTESGLSITSWKPITGAIPPLSEADWQVEFDAYKTIPQYSANNSWMALEDFKSIFWWEWIHRFLGRFLGFAFAVPFVVFLVQKRIPRTLTWPLAGLFVLGGLQGVLGWWMVSSGLTELTSVSQYRLAAHLTAAALLFMALVYVPRTLEPRAQNGIVRPANMWVATALLVLITIQIAAGGFVAGLDAGMGHNTWPLMDGALIPSGLGAMQPGWRNLFENALTVQFIHRCIAYFIVAFVIFSIWRQDRAKGGAGGVTGVHRWLSRIGLIVVLQVMLGIATLLFSVPIELAVSHQALAFILAGATSAYLADMWRTKGR